MPNLPKLSLSFFLSLSYAHTHINTAKEITANNIGRNKSSKNDASFPNRRRLEQGKNDYVSICIQKGITNKRPALSFSLSRASSLSRIVGHSLVFLGLNDQTWNT